MYNNTSSELIKALVEDNKILRRLELVNDYLDGSKEFKYLYAFFVRGYRFIELKGWGSGIINKLEVLNDIVIYSHKWEITDYKIEDYPWKSL